MQVEIRDITGEDVRRSAEVIRESFRTVAEDMGLTASNCPTHPSFIKASRLEESRARGHRFLGLFLEGEQVGFVAIERADDELYYIERLAVIPRHRHKGLGRQLVEFAINAITQMGGRRVSLGTIDEQTVLKKWYGGLGFVETGTKRFEHLPFTVCFMERRVE